MASLDQFPPATIQRLRRQVLTWFGASARALPWRTTQDPYCIWVSEIMLQQTTVKAVVPYFERFIARFPTVLSLAAATEAEVLRHWEGLGYYSRGRNLRLAAIKVRDVYHGVMPDTVDDLETLPGIGRYTAGAIVSFAFNRPAPIVEANTLRLYARLLGYDGDPRSAAGQRLLWDFAGRLPSATHAGQINQALMELGSLVCTPREPQCDICPVRACCGAFRTGTQLQIPRLAKRPEVTPLVEACVAIQRNGRWLLRQRTADERWAGLWDFPRCAIDTLRYEQRLTTQSRQRVIAEIDRHLRDDWQLDAEVQSTDLQIRHSVTRYRIRLLSFQAEWRQGEAVKGATRWVRPAEFADLPLSVTARQVANWVSGNE